MDFGGGDITGRDQIVGTPAGAALDDALRPLIEAISKSTPSETRTAAETKLEALKTEAAKGSSANDDSVAGLVEGIVDAVPETADAVVSAFGSPILGKIAGGATKYVLGKLRHNSV